MHPEVQSHSSDHIIDRQTELSIRAGLDGFSFYTTAESGEIIFFKNFDFLIEKENLLLRKFSELLPELTGQHFKTVTVNFTGKEINMVPEPYFQEKLKKFPFSAKHHSSEERECLQHHLPGIGAILLFYIPAKLTGFFSTNFPGCRFSHEIVHLIQYTGTRKDSFLVLQLHASWITCVVVREGILSLVNTYGYHHDNDLLFFILSLTTHFNLGNNPILVSGRGHRFDEKLRLIRNYLPGATEFSFFPGEGLSLRETGLPFH